MRFLDADDMLLLLPAEPKQQKLAKEKLAPLFDRYGGDRDRLTKLTDLGKLETMQINLDGKPWACVWFSIECARLVIDTLLILSPSANPEKSYSPAWEAVKILGQSRGCDSVEGVTSRKGLAKVYLDNGFEPRGVLFRKKLS